MFYSKYISIPSLSDTALPSPEDLWALLELFLLYRISISIFCKSCESVPQISVDHKHECPNANSKTFTHSHLHLKPGLFWFIGKKADLNKMFLGKQLLEMANVQ